LQFLFRKAKAGEILIDQNRDCLAQIGRRLTFRKQHVLAVERREVELIPLELCRSHDPVWLEIGTEKRQIEAGIATIRHGHTQDQRVGLLTRPMRHVAGADIAREDFLARHFRDAINPVFQDAVATVPSRPRQQLIFEQGRKSPCPERR
jgi:hypothetical protein